MASNAIWILVAGWLLRSAFVRTDRQRTHPDPFSEGAAMVLMLAIGLLCLWQGLR